MITKERIIEKYQLMNDAQILKLHDEIHTLSDVGKEALSHILNERGGFDKLHIQREQVNAFEIEKNKLRAYFFQKTNEGIPSEQIKLHSDILDEKQLDEIHQKCSSEFEKEKKDKSINVRTILGGLGGMFIGGILGGIFWGVQMIYSGHIFYIFAIALAVINYGIIRLITGQSKENPMVLIFSGLGIGISLFIGFVLYDIFGYLGGH